MKWIYYNIICNDPVKRLRYNIRTESNRLVKLLQDFLVLEAEIAAGNISTRRYVRRFRLETKIRNTKLILKAYRTLIKQKRTNYE